MSELSSNLVNQQARTVKPEIGVETAGTIAQNAPSPALFTVSAETAGSIASNTSSSGGSSFCANA